VFSFPQRHVHFGYDWELQNPLDEIEQKSETKHWKFNPLFISRSGKGNKLL